MSDGKSWRYCARCGKTKPARQFYSNGKKTRGICRPCENARMRKRYEARLEFVRSYKLERGCADCGYRGHPAALEFDHLPQFEKKYTISQILAKLSVPHDELVAEMAKCDVVCANCHRVRTFARGDHGAFHELRRAHREDSSKPAGPPPFEQLTLEV
ncbi:hypothetical protein [Rhodococcus ruber]|uniref:hypothetical protein n=1 Tax=Rhodococcus ruber TaxID=1830 RepID=UPI003D819F25